jgi:hypothetical protein
MAKVEIVGETRLPRDDVRQAVASAVKARLAEVEGSIDRLSRSLRGFEAEYSMSTGVFVERYLAGGLGENLDFMEWRACKELLADLVGEKALLEEIVV